MKLKLSDYIIGLFITIPMFFMAFFGLSALSNLNTLTISAISFIVWMLDYTNHITNVKTNLIIEQMQNKIDELSKK